MREINALGYLGITTADIDRWRTFSRDVLGMQVIESEGELFLRADERAWRLQVSEGPREGVAFIGWEVRDAPGLERLGERLLARGVEVKEDSALAERRGVDRLLSCADPDGNSLEFFYGARVAATPFVSPLGHRFVTGEQGLGHVVLYAEDAAATEAFYLDILGFALSDMILLPGVRVMFTRVNPRHHSLAFGHVPNSTERFAHLMLQVDAVDAVGLLYDRVLDGAAELAQTIGRHTNDRMLSFYLRTPSGFEIEFGAQGREVDEATWSVSTYDRQSIWGHRPVGAGPTI